MPTTHGPMPLDRVVQDEKDATAAIERAREALRHAIVLSGCWVDDIRQHAEHRLGITDLDDQRIWEDEPYTAAQDRWSPLLDAQRALDDAVSAWTEVGPALRGEGVA